VLKRIASLAALIAILASALFAQGLTTTATKNDWEEINFEFNSHILSDGYPSLLRLAELLNKNPDYRAKVVGNTDWVGGHPYNDKLALRRAETVKNFLTKYGASPNQIATSASGKRDPKVDNKTAEGRFMNRRVTLTVTDANGRIIGDGGPGDIIPMLEKLMAQQEECCNNILKRLDRLDEIMKELEALRAELKNLRAAAPEAKPAAPAPPPPPPGATRAEVEDIVDRALARNTQPRFSILGLNVGADDEGRVTFSGRGRYFAPFREHFAVQAQGEYMYFRDRQEGQGDLGLVTRWDRLQLGGFSSFKTISFRDYQQAGTLGQAAFMFDYLFRGGKIGAFGTKSFLNNAVINREFGFNRVTETYLNVVDQLGGQGTVQLGRHAWLEGNIGYLKTKSDNDKAGGTLRFVFPLNNRFAFTVEGGVNETLVGPGNNGRAVAGILFGNFTQPRDFLDVSHPVPMDVPRVRYELLTRTIRTGNAPPVVVAQDQIGVQPGQITLDASDSYDPDGDPITFQWSQVAGPAVSIAGANMGVATFNAEAGQTYGFRVAVRDDQNLESVGRVTVSTRENRARIIRFTANPPVISPGDTATLNYTVENADSVTITGVSQTLDPNAGSVSVNPGVTTNYTLTARNAHSEDTAVVTVIVEEALPRVVNFSANPPNIAPGGTSNLTWTTQNADSVEIVGIGTFGPNGQTPVSPAQSTTYTLIARNQQGETQATATVIVGPGVGAPIIRSFTANPQEIAEGQCSNLSWAVEGAETVTISTIGEVPASGSREVCPTANTTYLLTATNQAGQSTANASIVVRAAVRIISFTIDPTTINQPFQSITLAWQTENAEGVFISEGIGPRPLSGSLTTVGPPRTTTYVLTAVGRGSQATASVTVTLDETGVVDPNRPPTAIIAGGPEIVTAFRELRLNAAGSFDPDGDQLTFQWRSIDGRAEVLDPSSPTPTVSLVDTNYGDFNFEVRVSDPSGASSVANVRVTLVQARPIF
jgi:hypothetical protein